jgi:GT2 family glycosyltransferase
MRLSVIIVNQNACVRLKQALKTILLSCEGITNEIFVVDNASIDGSVGMVQQEFPEVQIILNEKPTSITKATNQALVLANGQYTLLINPDTITKKDTLSKTLAFMDKRPEAGGLTVRMVDPMGNFLSQSKRGLSTQWVAFFKLTGLSKMLSKSRLYDRMHEYWFEDFETSEIDILSSAFMLLRSSVLQRTGFLGSDRKVGG